MKKLNVMLVLAFLLAVAMPDTFAQNKQLEKARKKEYKAKMKEFKNDNWKIYGTTHTLDVALLEHYESLKAQGAYEVVGVASSFISKNVGQQAAMNAACNNYARAAGSSVRGRIVGDIFNNAVEIPTEFDKFYAAYESKVEKEIKGEMKPSFSVIRSKGVENGKEVFEMQSFFIVNEAEASKARIRAMEYAFKESEMAQKYAEKVSEFVQEAFEIEN